MREAVLELERRARTTRRDTCRRPRSRSGFACVSVTLTPSTSTVPPLFGRVGHVHLDALSREPAAQLDLRDDGAAELLCERDRVADVVAVAVREEDRVDPLGLLLRVGALRVPVQERIDVDALAARGVDAEGRMPEPGECRRHDEILRGMLPTELRSRASAREPDYGGGGRLCRPGAPARISRASEEEGGSRGKHRFPRVERTVRCGGEHRRMTMRLASVLLVVGAALADAAGSHSLAYYSLVVAVPLVALAALSALGDVLDGTAAEPHDRGMAALTALALPLVLLGAAVRAPLARRRAAAGDRSHRRRRLSRGLRSAGAARCDVRRPARAPPRRLPRQVTDCYLARRAGSTRRRAPGRSTAARRRTSRS